MPVLELCREHGISSATFSKWRAKYGGVDASMMSQMKAFEDANWRLKRMFAALSMQAELLREKKHYIPEALRKFIYQNQKLIDIDFIANFVTFRYDCSHTILKCR